MTDSDPNKSIMPWYGIPYDYKYCYGIYNYVE